jgi:frataxin-like iron-binding protein CyaY
MKVTTIPKSECRNHKALKRVLSTHLDYFERLTNWAEMADWLQKLARHIETYDTIYLPCKKAIAKRLNQSLNIPNLPIGIHRTNMTIYDLVFDILSKRKSALAKNIAIFSFGLFSMFKKAQLEIKHSIIGLFEKYYLPMQEQLVPMLNGLIGCLLSGMNDSETEMKGKILKLLIKINNCVGDHVYMSALWQVLLKNSQTQIQCIKALVHKLEKSKDKLKVTRKTQNPVLNETDNGSLIVVDDQETLIQIPKKTTNPKFPNQSRRELTEEDVKKRKQAFGKLVESLKKGNEEDVRVNFFPNNCMVVNAIIKCLENPDVHVVKGILDLLIAYIGFQKGKTFIYSTPKLFFIFVNIPLIILSPISAHTCCHNTHNKKKPQS